MELKFMQNNFISGNLSIFTTMMKIYVYSGKNLIGSAGVKNKKDFDYNALLNIAMSNSKLLKDLKK